MNSFKYTHNINANSNNLKEDKNKNSEIFEIKNKNCHSFNLLDFQ